MKQNLSKLMETELEKAELVLAAKAISQDVQDMLEKAAKVRVDDVMPLVDRMKEVFGQQSAEQFQQTVDNALETLQNTLATTKDDIENSANIINGEMPAGSDMIPGADDMGMGMDDELGGEPEGEFGDEGLPGDAMGAEDDMFGSADANAGGEEPLGRARKESRRVRRSGQNLSERTIRRSKQRLAHKIKIAEKRLARLKIR